MNKSETIGKLAKALCAVQSELRPAVKDAANPFFKSKYADLNAVWDSCRALLAQNSLSVAQVNQITLEGVVVETVLMHESGEWISGELYLPLAKQDPQGVGSAITYGRRYGLAAIIGIVSDEDNDGNRASNRVQSKPNKPKDAPISERIANAKKAIQDLGGTVAPQNSGESDADFLNSLNEQYKQIKNTLAQNKVA